MREFETLSPLQRSAIILYFFANALQAACRGAAARWSAPTTLAELFFWGRPDVPGLLHTLQIVGYEPLDPRHGVRQGRFVGLSVVRPGGDAMWLFAGLAAARRRCQAMSHIYGRSSASYVDCVPCHSGAVRSGFSCYSDFESVPEEQIPLRRVLSFGSRCLA